MAGSWDPGQLALFEAIASIVERVGRDGAQDLANDITAKPTQRFIDKMREADENAKIVNILQEVLAHYENDKWTPEELKETLEDGKRKAMMLDQVLAWPVNDLKNCVNRLREEVGVMYPINSAGPSGAPAAQAPTLGLDDIEEDTELMPRLAPGKAQQDSMDEYRKRTNAKIKKVIDANRTLQTKLRQVSDNRNRWSKYAEHLEKKLERSNALLKENKLAVPSVSKENTAEPAEVQGRPQTLEGDVDGGMAMAETEFNRSKDVPNLARRILEMGESGSREAQAAAVAAPTPDINQQSIPANRLTEDAMGAEMAQYNPRTVFRTYMHPEVEAEPALLQKHRQEELVRNEHVVLHETMKEQANATPETYADFISKLDEYHQQRGTIFDPRPNVGAKHVDLQDLYLAVIARGGYDRFSKERMGWTKLAQNMGYGSRAFLQLRTVYYKYLAAYEIEHFHGKEAPPWEILEDVPLKAGPLLTRTLENFATDAQKIAVSKRQQREEAALKASTSKGNGNGTPAATSLGAPVLPSLSYSAIQPKPFPEPTLPKLPKLIHAATIPDSLASSSSLSAPHTSSTQAEHPTSGANIIHAAEVNEANAVAAASSPPPSDDEPPVVVSSRQLRKRKPTGSSPMRKKIKQERLASSPIALLGLRHLQTQESMDLDDIGPKTATPKKRSEKLRVIGHEYVPAHGRVYEHPPDFMSRLDDDPGTPETPLERPPLPGTPMLLASAATVLKPRSVNTLVLPRTSAKLHPAKRRRLEGTEKGAQLFSEDGENHLARDDAETIESPSRLLPRATVTRLSNLLEKPSPRRWQVMNMDDELHHDDNAIAGIEPTVTARQPMHQRLAAQRAPPQDNFDDDLPEMADVIKRESGRTPASVRHLHFDTPAAQNRPTPLSGLNKYGRKVREDIPSTARPDEEPLATRPVSRLSLDDFRINPEYNNGLDYAYRDVVRGRERRKCLAGCTDPSCCGKGFRALAEIATPVRNHVTLAQKEEEDKLLRDFIGRDADRLIKSMNKEERRATLVDAKTRELANKHGKHRHAYERRKSPPGFWRTDFPTTQEEAEDREKAKQFERDLVQKRYEEAMRGGGKWIFKDQKGGRSIGLGTTDSRGNL